MLKFREEFPRQTAAELVVRTGASLRHCERVLAGRSGLGDEFLIELILSDFGRSALSAATTGKRRPSWFARFERETKISDLREAEKTARREREALEAAE